MNGSINGNIPAKDFSLLKNWEDSTISRDTLYKKACPINICSKSQCKGSVMNPSHMVVDPRTWNRPIEETHRLAKDFIDQYYQSTRRNGSKAHIERLEEVKRSIDETETYELTEQELIYGAKMSWRNAARCIGRIQWQKLHVADCRYVTTTQEMFQAICNQLNYATNNGNIRSAITVFPPRRDYKTEFRVWNTQILRYAGYRQSDGSVIGDPVSVELTEICERLGWKGKGTQFDVLPLVLQANGEDPDWYEIPEDLVLEVKLRHPQYKWFEEMELKWYAVPGVSSIMIDIGGVQFAACPFNGWFMGTEIARDLCDVSRYNMLQPIARKMGLDTSNLSSFWKDKAILEVTIAIMYSFQSDRVTIMDHHVATESFMKHFNNELKLRNGCPGDWVWLVPPISGSTTPIFHQEILNYILNPACYYQVDPWKYYTWKDAGMLQPHHSHLNFRELSRSVRLTTSLMAKAMSKRIKVVILYATETGKSEEYAKLLQKIFNFAFNAKVVPMSEYNVWQLEFETMVLVVTSTFGNGDPPENGEEFAEMLLRKSRGELIAPSDKRRFSDFAPKSPLSERPPDLNPPEERRESFLKIQGDLANVKFSVFGLGSTAYPNFCAFAHSIDTMLGEMGAERLLEIGEGDELAGQEDSFKNWAKNIFAVACQAFCLSDINMKDAVHALGLTAYDKNNFRVEVQDTDVKEDSIINSLAKLHHKELSSCKLAERVDLHSREDGRATILVKIQRKDSLLQFEPGDHIGIYPQNNSTLVQELLERINDVPEQSSLIQLQIKSAKGEWEPSTRLPVCSVWNAFSRYLDITTPPTPQFLKLLADFATNDEDREKLQLLSKGSLEYDEWKNTYMADMVDVLNEFSSVRVELSLLLSQLPLLQCRYYSISSSPDVHPDQIHCTVSVVSYSTERGNGHVHHGVCSTFLDKLEPGEEVFCFIRQAPLFHLPPEMNTPCILVGPGTGIAPFRSFWQQRMHKIKMQDNGKCPMSLFFGCRKPSDRLYEKELAEAVDVGALSHTYTAYSRSTAMPKTYVQNIMADETSNYLFETLHKQKGHMYVCGDVTMAADVSKTLHEIFAQEGKMTVAEAAAAIKEIKNDKRYHEDIFGVTLKTKEVTKEKVKEALTVRRASMLPPRIIEN